MNQNTLDTLFAYSAVCHRQLHQVLSENLSLFDVPFETVSRFNSLRKIMAHCVAAEERLITLRLQQKPGAVFYEDRAAETWDGLFADLWAVRAKTDAFRATLSADDYERPVILTLPQWNLGATLTFGDVLFHIVNHENYHRGQVIMALQRFGVDPPNFDFILLRPDIHRD